MKLTYNEIFYLYRDIAFYFCLTTLICISCLTQIKVWRFFFNFPIHKPFKHLEYLTSTNNRCRYHLFDRSKIIFDYFEYKRNAFSQTNVFLDFPILHPIKRYINILAEYLLRVHQHECSLLVYYQHRYYMIIFKLVFTEYLKYFYLIL